MSALLLALSFALAEEDAAAKKLFQAVEKKIAAAKSMKVEFNGKFKSSKRTFEIKGSIIVAKGNRIRMNTRVKMGAPMRDLFAVSDGTNLIRRAGGESKTEPAPKTYGKRIRTSVGRYGPTFAVFSAVAGTPRERQGKLITASDIKLGKDEKLGKRNVKTLTFRLDFPKEPLNVKVWIDVKSGLPLKRVLTSATNPEDGLLTETTTYTLNPKLDEKTFKLPE